MNTLMSLAEHCWNITFDKKITRMSRGEVFLTSQIFGLLSFLSFGVLALFRYFLVSMKLTIEVSSIITITLLVLTVLYYYYLLTILYIKRAHDLDYSGHILRCILIPLVNIILMIYITFFKGTIGVNKYGEDSLPRQQVYQNRQYRAVGFVICMMFIGFSILGASIPSLILENMI